MNKNRGTLLTLITLFYAFATLAMAGLLIFYWDNPSSLLRNAPSWYPVLGAVAFAASFIGFVGIWNFKKWGVYLALGGLAVSILARYMVLGKLEIFNIFLVLLAYALYKKWPLFK